MPFALVVNPSLPAHSLGEFIAYAKSKPGELSYGSAGNGSPQHLGAEMLKSAAALDIKHVPYKGSVPAMLDVIGGHIPLMVVDLQPALPQVRAGKLRALGVTTAARVGSAPDIRRWPSPVLRVSNLWPGKAWWRLPACRGHR